MNDPERRKQLASILEQRRRELGERPDVSARVRDLSHSSGRHPLNPRRVRRPSLITALVAGAAVCTMLLCAGGAGLLIISHVWFQDQFNSPTVVAEQYYAALHEQDYARAYSYFSDATRGKLSSTTFADQSRAYDQVSGVVLTYTVAQSTTNGAHATITMNVTRQGSSDQAQTQVLYLSQQSGDWHIDTVVIQAAAATPAA